MKRLAATLAGLALVLLPSAIAMSSASPTSSLQRTNATPAYMQYLNGAPSSAARHRGGRHCHRDKSRRQQQSTSEPDV